MVKHDRALYGSNNSSMVRELMQLEMCEHKHSHENVPLCKINIQIEALLDSYGIYLYFILSQEILNAVVFLLPKYEDLK